MAEVFRGRMSGVEGFERMVALKRILPNIAADPDFVEMFVDEAKLAVQLQHANIAQIYELGKVGESHFIAMEYISGVSLRIMWDRARGRGKLLPIPMSCYIMQKVCEGLDAAHRKRIGTGEELRLVHRDVSPQNILVSFEGEVKVIDFGIAKAANKVSKTQAGVLKGKFGYMSPEQVRGIELDNRSDIFACGVVLYELLVGDRLFLGESDFSTLEKIRNVEMVPPTQLNAYLNPHVERIVMKALCKRREDRYRWASEMAEDLQRYLVGTNQIFSRTDLQRYMQQHFREEMREEAERLERYRQIRIDDLLSEDDGVGEGAVPSRGASEAATQVGFAALPGAPGGPADPPVSPEPSPAELSFQVHEPSARSRTDLVHTAASASPPPRLPTWAAVLIGSLSTLLLLAVGGFMLWSRGLLTPPGTITIEFEPRDAFVFLDDRLIAKGSPVTLESLDPGTHVLTVRREGFEEAIRPVAVAGGEERMLSIRLEPTLLPTLGTLEVVTRPAGLRVLLDGEDTSKTTPVTLAGLPSGPHEVKLLRADGGLVHRFTADVLAEKTAMVEVDVAALPPVLEVSSIPPGAEVRVNGMLRGLTPATLSDIPAGRARIELRKPGCRPLRTERRLSRGLVAVVEAELGCD